MEFPIEVIIDGLLKRYTVILTKDNFAYKEYQIKGRNGNMVIRHRFRETKDEFGDVMKTWEVLEGKLSDSLYQEKIIRSIEEQTNKFQTVVNKKPRKSYK